VGESAWGHAIVTVARDGIPLSFYFPAPRLGAPSTADRADPAVPEEREDPVRSVRIARQLCVAADLDQPPTDSADAYLRLHLLSHRLVRPNSMSLDGIFKVLPNVCWTSLGPVAVSEIGGS
jgi:2,3,4,5-tetrahydropyridine-2,6-dicarboxylate N-succinyltransferase